MSRHAMFTSNTDNEVSTSSNEFPQVFGFIGKFSDSFKFRLFKISIEDIRNFFSALLQHILKD